MWSPSASGCSARFDAIATIIPIGMEMTLIYDQPEEVERSVSGFIVSVAQAVAIVLVVLLAFMGLRTGIVIGAVLLITVAGTLFLMYLFGIELQRISLGALVIALGMLVDNAIVVAEGMQVRMQSGMTATAAAREASAKPSGPCWAAPRSASSRSRPSASRRTTPVNSQAPCSR